MTQLVKEEALGTQQQVRLIWSQMDFVHLVQHQPKESGYLRLKRWFCHLFQ